MDKSNERPEMETWWGLEEAMDFLSTSRRFTLRASRVSSVVSRWPLDMETTSLSSRSRLLPTRLRPPIRTTNNQPKIVEIKPETKVPACESKPNLCTPDNETLRDELKDAHREIKKLQAVINDLTKVNKRWQQYDNDRQFYIQKLLTTIQDQHEQINKIGEKCNYPVIDQDRLGSTNVIKGSDTTRLLENNILRLEEEGKRLNEKIEVLEFQVKANKDDWEAEYNEKKQVIKEKLEIEERVHQLMSELQDLKQSILSKRFPLEMEMVCQACRSKFLNSANHGGPSNSNSVPNESKLYRSAVHFPCSSQQSNEKSNQSFDPRSKKNEKFDCSDTVQREYSSSNQVKEIKYNRLDSDNCTDNKVSESECSFLSNYGDDMKKTPYIWNVGHYRLPMIASNGGNQDVGPSFSNASTIPLVSSPEVPELSTPSDASCHSLAGSGINEPVQYQFTSNGGATVTSCMQIPISKSSSVPSSKSEHSMNSFEGSSISYNISTSPSAPTPITLNNVSKKNENVANEGVDTFTFVNITCPNCDKVFLPKKHLLFLDHFKTCQKNY